MSSILLGTFRMGVPNLGAGGIRKAARGMRLASGKRRGPASAVFRGAVLGGRIWGVGAAPPYRRPNAAVRVRGTP